MTSPAQLILQKEFKQLRSRRHAFFYVSGLHDNDFFVWQLVIRGPPNTLFAGGLFSALLRFPQTFPMSPPSLQFTSDIWHPNIYRDGKVCITTLQSPVPNSSNSAENWRPVLGVEQVILSVVSLLSDPNFESPANGDAAREWATSEASCRRRLADIVRRSQEAFAGMDIPFLDIADSNNNSNSNGNSNTSNNNSSNAHVAAEEKKVNTGNAKVSNNSINAYNNNNSNNNSIAIDDEFYIDYADDDAMEEDEGENDNDDNDKMDDDDDNGRDSFEIETNESSEIKADERATTATSSPATATAGTTTEWTCKRCTFVNATASNRCDACEEKRN